MKWTQLLSVGLILTGGVGSAFPATATTIGVSATEAFDSWIREQDPPSSVTPDGWIVNGSELHYTDTGNQALISNFTLLGDFSFTSRIQSLGIDDDRFGLFFGYQDINNNYRFSWEGDFINGGFPEADGSRGLSLVQEVDGISTSLFNLPTLSWTQNTPYNITVYRAGDTIGFEVQDVGGNAIASTSISDTTFTEGAIGLWNSSQQVAYSNLEYTTNTEVPEPTSLLAITTVGLGLFLCRHTNKGINMD